MIQNMEAAKIWKCITNAQIKMVIIFIIICLFNILLFSFCSHFFSCKLVFFKYSILNIFSSFFWFFFLTICTIGNVLLEKTQTESIESATNFPGLPDISGIFKQMETFMKNMFRGPFWGDDTSIEDNDDQ